MPGGCFVSGKRSLISGAFVLESDFFKNSVPLYGGSGIFAFRLIPYRTGRGQMVLFSLQLECKRSSPFFDICDRRGKGRFGSRDGAFLRNLSVAVFSDLRIDRDMVLFL